MKRIFKILYDHKEWLLLGLVLCVAYYLRIFGIKSGLPYPWHCDEPHLMHTALRILKTGDFNPHDSTYPNLTIYLHTINAILCYISILTDPLTTAFLPLKDILTNADTPEWYWTISHPVFYEWGRRLTVLFGTMSVGIVYLLCSRYYSSLLAAVLASLFLACCLGHLSLSVWITVDVPTAFFILATAFSSVVLMRKGEKKLYLISGLLAGLSIAAKYNSWPVVILPLLGHILNTHKSRFFNSDVLLILIAAPLGFLIGSPYSIADLPGFFEKGAGWAIWHYTHIPGWNIFSSNPDIALAKIPTGQYTMRTQLLYYYHAFCQDRWAIGGGGGVGTFILYSAAIGIFSGFFVNWRVHLIMLAYPIVFILYMSTMQGNFMRNMTAVNAFLCIFAGLFVCQILNVISSQLKKMRVPPVYRNICVCLAGILFLINPLYKAINWSIENYQNKDSRVLAVEWLKQHLKKPQKIAFASELKWFKPDIEKLGLQHVFIGQLEKEPVWYWNEGFDYVVVGRKYSGTADLPIVLKYNKSFLNIAAVKSFGESGVPLDWFPISPMLDILKVDANFCDSITWDTNRNFFEFNLIDFKNRNYRNPPPLDATSNQISMERTAPLCSPRVVFEEGEYEVEITAYGSPAAGFFPLMKLESVKWKDGMPAGVEIIGEWKVEKEEIFRSGMFHCQKGDVLSFNIRFSNNEDKPNRQLYIKEILVKKKGGS